MRDASTGQSASDADAYLKRLLSFEFLVSAVVSHHVLGYTRPLTVALQAKCCDLLIAHRMAQRLIKVLEEERAPEKFETLWQQTNDIATRLGIQPCKKRTVSRQRHRANPVVEDVKSHYRVTYYYAFLDHTISHMKSRFPKQLEGALFGSYLLPCNIDQLDTQKIATIRNEFEGVLPQMSDFEREISVWKAHVSELELDDDVKKSLQLICSIASEHCTFYPNICTVFSLLTLPVGSCSCERSFSALKRLKMWCRNSMTNSRLDMLAMGYINRECTQSAENVLRTWDLSGDRRIALAFTEGSV